MHIKILNDIPLTEWTVKSYPQLSGYDHIFEANQVKIHCDYRDSIFYNFRINDKYIISNFNDLLNELAHKIMQQQRKPIIEEVQKLLESIEDARNPI